MRLSEIMSANSIVLSIKANSKRQLLQELAQKASELTGINDRTIFDTILERENLGSTGFGGGTALPHGRLGELKEVKVGPLKLVEGNNTISITVKNKNGLVGRGSTEIEY